MTFIIAQLYSREHHDDTSSSFNPATKHSTLNKISYLQSAARQLFVGSDASMSSYCWLAGRSLINPRTTLYLSLASLVWPDGDKKQKHLKTKNETTRYDITM